MAWLTQVAFLLKTLLRLKLWRFVFAAVTVACLLSNLYIYSNATNLMSQFTNSYLGLTTYNGSSLAASGVVLTEKSEDASRMLQIMRHRGFTDNSWLHDCDRSDDCRKNFFNLLHSRLGSELVASVDFNDTTGGKNLAVDCRSTDDAELGCPHLVQLAMQARVKPESVFKDVEFFSLIDQQDQTGDRGGSSTTGDTVCNDALYGLLFPVTLVAQVILVSSGIVLYLVLSNMASISKLKESGFLQLMIHNGLSVSSYWVTVWGVTVIEMLVFAGVTTASYGLQCPGFYRTDRLFLAFVGVFAFFMYLSSLTYLSSVIIKSYFLQVLMMILVNVVMFILVLLCRFVLIADDKAFYRYVSLIAPGGHVAEFLFEALLTQNRLSGYHLSILVMMWLVTAILFCLTMALDFLVDAGNGLKLPLTFAFDRRFWRTSCVQGDTHPMLQIEDSLMQKPNIEPVPDTYKRSVQISNVYKTYTSRSLPCITPKVVKAVNGVSCAIYENQITALIGHNGAGKTTLIKVLIGDEQPSSGSATVGGCHITDPLERLRMRGGVGICHQTNVLSSSLTVQQSIELTLVSKGLRVEDEMDEAMQLLKRLDMHDKRQVQATSLSGGQKRKLCTILALLGHPKVVFLDEPTSGLDPVSRRHLWQILQEYKVGRCIILCTQFMDEADILADRKIFLSDGSLICAGSSLFLKHAFGCGFVFNVSLKFEKSAGELMRLLKGVCDGVELKNQFKTELELQMSQSLSQSVPSVLRILESRADLVDAFGLSQATLDEIFMRLKDVKADQLMNAFNSGRVNSVFDNVAESVEGERRQEFQQLLASQTTRATSASAPKQFSALMGMNIRRLRRTRMKLCCRFIFPAILLLALAGSIYLESVVGSFTFPVVANSTIGGQEFHGVCIANADDADKINETQCKSIFSSESSLWGPKAAILVKDKNTTLPDFLTNSTTLSAMNETCSESPFFKCAFAFASSWKKSSVNSNRSLNLGIYRSHRATFGFFESIVSHSTAFKRLSDFFGSAINSDVFVISPMQDTFFPLMGTFVVVILLSIIPVTYISDPIEDKESRVRYQLASMGMSSMGYWLTTYLLHWVQYAVFVVVSAILFVAFLSKTYANLYFVLGLCLPLLLFGTTSNQLTVYMIGSLLKKPNPLVTIVYFFIVFFMSIAILFIQLNNVLSLILIWCLPPFASVSLIFFGTKLGAYAMAIYKEDTLANVPDLTSVFFSNPLVLSSLVAPVVHLTILTVIVLLLERKSFLMSYCKSFLSRRVHQAAPGGVRDAGVEQEVSRLETSMRNDENVLEVRRLEKTYPNGVKAVKGVTFGCVSGEIFGLLGPNGAGKTTTLSVVVGEEAATAGSCEVRFLDSWMSGSSGATNGAIGYCPQHNPLFHNITVFEHLQFYASVRGVESATARRQIENLVQGLGLSQHRNKRAEQLSGGNKRRLCLAIALLGNPSVVVIDEASTGVDPEAKRFIWSAIRAMVTNTRSVVVTTHSMEEVEALCTRVAIMSHGRVIAFGTIQQLRSRYGHAYTLDILLDVGQEDSEASVGEKKRNLVTSLMDRFKDCRVVEDLSTRLQLLVPQESIGKLSDALQWLTDCQVRLAVKYFSFYQMSLDQVFVRLVKEHEEAKATANGIDASAWTLA